MEHLENFKKDFIPFEEAKAMKALGFDEPCLAFYNGKHLDFDIWDAKFVIGQRRSYIGKCAQAPTFSQAFRWFRENHGLHSVVDRLPSGAFTYIIDWFPEDVHGHKKLSWGKKSYDDKEAELACINKLIEIVIQKAI